MNKPFSVAHADFKQELASLINRSGLPLFVVEYVLQDYLSEVKAVSKRQYQLEKAEYEKALAEAESAKESFADNK